MQDIYSIAQLSHTNKNMLSMSGNTVTWLLIKYKKLLFEFNRESPYYLL